MAVQDAELKLKVSLDLAFFRQQLLGLGQAAAGTSVPIQVKFDRLSVQNELNALGVNIRRRNYRLNIETNLSAEIAKADTLARKLSELSGQVKAAAGGTFSRGPQGAAGLERFMREQGLTGRAFNVQQTQEQIAKQAILSRLGKRSLIKGGYNIAGLEKIIRDLGGTPTGNRGQLTAQAKKLVEEADGIADAVFDNLKNLQMKLRPIRGQAQTSATRSMPNLNEMLDRMANLTSNPRAAQRMLRMLPESRVTTDLVGAANRQAAFQQQFPQGYTLPGFNAPRAFDPLLKTIAKSFSDYARTVNISNPWVGQIGNGIAGIIAKASTSPQATRLLPAVGGTTSPLNTLEARLASSRGMLGTGGGAAGSLFTGRGSVNPGVSMLSPVGISGGYRQMAAALANQAANPALAHRQIADIGFGAVPTSATGLSGQALNTVLNQAFLQRRGLGASGAQSRPIFSTGGVAVQQNIPGMAYPMAAGLGGSMGQFPMAGMMGPSTPLSINARTSMFGGGGGLPPRGPFGGFGGTGGMGGQFNRALGNIQLPGAGMVRELGDEFGMATKQVLLFGTAYKALAFATSFPAQVGQAVGALQTFNNTLKAVSPTAQEAKSSNELILDLVSRYNVPLQSARDGFTKLYASMQPAGFSGDEVRTIFTGISKAAAAFGMSADKVDRVNYAFAQMASKGQVMSEELKGQLGDVLPGAMAIFAEAAGFKGPDAIQKFSAALEEGAYKGTAMKVLLQNVGTIMNKEFGPGAEGAARTFQGAMNRMQNSLTLLYEGFEPIAVGFLNAVVMPLTNGIKQVTDGLNAFLTGTTAKTAGGFAFAQQLENLRPTFQGIQQNVQQVIPVLQQFGKVALQVAQTLLQIAGNPFVGYLARVYLSVLPLTLAIQTLNLRALVPMIANFLRAIPAFVAFNAAAAQGVTTNKALQLAMYTTGQTAGVTAGQIRTVSLALKAAFASTVILAVVAGIGMIIERLMTMNAKMEETRQKALNAAQAIRSMSATDARSTEQRTSMVINDLKRLRTSNEDLTLGKDRVVTVPGDVAKRLEAAGVPVRSDLLGRKVIERAMIESYIQQQSGISAEARFRQGQLSFEDKQAATPAVIAPVPPASPDGSKPKEGKRIPIEEIMDYESQRAMRLKASNMQLALDRKIAAAKMAGNDAEAESLESLRGILKINGEISELETFRNMLIDKEAQLIDKTFTKKKYEDKLNDTNVKIHELKNDLQSQYLKLQISEKDQQKKAEEELSKRIEKQLQLNRLIEDAAIAAGTITPGEARKRAQQREFDDQLLRAKELGATPEQLVAIKDFQVMTPQAGSIQEKLKLLREELEKLASTQETVTFSANAIGEAFANSFKSVISGASSAQQALGSFFQSIADAFLDMAAQMIKKWVEMQIIGLAQSLLSPLTKVPGSSIVKGMDVPIAQMPAGMQFANGGIAAGGFMPITPFASGGIVTGPTLGLVGEGRYNEAVIPMPNGKSVPVELGGAMGSPITSNIVVNVSSDGKTSSSNTGSDSAGLGRRLEGAVKQVIVDELRPGGLLSGRR
jgi:tape measure domain-containing protein